MISSLAILITVTYGIYWYTLTTHCIFKLKAGLSLAMKTKYRYCNYAQSQERASY